MLGLLGRNLPSRKRSEPALARDVNGVRTHDDEVLALLRKWRSEIDAAELTVPLDHAALRNGAV